MCEVSLTRRRKSSVLIQIHSTTLKFEDECSEVSVCPKLYTVLVSAVSTFLGCCTLDILRRIDSRHSPDDYASFSYLLFNC